MAAQSPYRVLAEPSADSPSPRNNPFRPRLFRPTAQGLAILASLVVHAVVLTASALSASPEPPPPDDTEATRFHSGAFVLHAEDFPFFCNWPPPSHLTGCFDRATLQKASYYTSRFEAYGADADGPTTAQFPYPLINYGDPEMASYELDQSLNECARTARVEGWKGEGRVFVRVTNRKAEGAVAQAFPMDPEANHPGLLCCIRSSQLPLASTMKPDTTVRYTLSAPVDEPVTLTPPPL